jgi:hypothetical protein
MKDSYQLFICLCLIFSFESLSSQYCNPFQLEETDFKAETRIVKVDAGWYPGWLKYKSGDTIYPDQLEPLQKWKHPFMKDNLPSAMHEDSYASDISNMQGPVPENPSVQYFQVREKGKEFSGMSPSFAFVDENTMVTLSFGRTNTTLLLLDIKDKIEILDAIKVPGRGHTAMELAGKKARMALFRNTSGGAYFFLSKDNEVIIPGPEYSIFYIPVKDKKFERDRMVQYDILEEIEKGDLLVEGIKDKEGRNKLTAVMPDAQGNIWYTSKMGVIGVIDLKEFKKGDYQNKGLCPRTHSFYIGEFGLLRKIEHYFGKKYDQLEDLEFYREGMSDVEYRKELRDFFMLDPETREEIQNSFSVGPDGVYIVSNIALYKLRFNEETKKIEMDPKWEDTFRNIGDQIYPNDGTQKKGQLNDGSGTTPTLMDDRFVIIADNDEGQINLNIYLQDNGTLVSRLPLFEKDSSACENSVVAYRNSLLIGNTYNYTDPFDFNDTPGGIDRYDLNPETGGFEKANNWPAEHVDAKTATPKMSTETGVIYVYNRQEESDDGHHDWQLTAIDYETGRKVFYIRPEFEKGEFKDNIFFLMKSFSMGLKNYDQKVFNNIWATYTFGPNNSIYIGAYRGFLKFSSDPRPE